MQSEEQRVKKMNRLKEVWDIIKYNQMHTRDITSRRQSMKNKNIQKK